MSYWKGPLAAICSYRSLCFWPLPLLYTGAAGAVGTFGTVGAVGTVGVVGTSAAAGVVGACWAALPAISCSSGIFSSSVPAPVV